MFPLERFAARKAAQFSQAMDIVAARSIGLKPSSVSIACENYHRGGFRSGKTLNCVLDSTVGKPQIKYTMGSTDLTTGVGAKHCPLISSSLMLATCHSRVFVQILAANTTFKIQWDRTNTVYMNS
jgi:hypothetical protein